MKKERHSDIEKLDSDCLEAFDHVYSYINNELKDENTIAMVKHHLGHCKSCFSRTQMERRINERLRESKESSAPELLRNRLRKLIDDL